MKKIQILFWSLLALIWISCGKERTLEPLEKNSTPPGKVSNVQWTAGPGYATITYALPSDPDLLYVKAVYNLASGREMEVKASYYGRTLKVEGFGDTDEHEVKLFAVNRSEVASEAVSIKVKPLENPIWNVFRSLSLAPDFSGIRVTASNLTKADLAFEVYAADSTGVLKPTANNIYTSAEEVRRTIRGYDSIPRSFAVTVRDRWLNYSDTLYANLTPLYEAEIPRPGFRSLSLPGDVGLHSSTPMTGMWDGIADPWPQIVMTSSAVLTPQWITFDIGKLATLSRIVIYDYGEYFNGRTYFYAGNLLDFEIWGTDNPPADGSFNNWVKMGTFKSVKPSGSPYGVNTAEDREIARAGISYTFEPGMPKVKYLRIKSNKNWQGTTYFAIAEVRVFGDPR
ncbi:MAG TPA: DUF5000 domain-containing lipoprotein [Niabella sp.]|nr:DUF5000 domain-containing lipoprotein [Niabella sp.]HOZ98284.1 DUF5000 domain-containing lipoprotein [Niabella sp.]HQW16318.1 DUF5000 domain-containing lipoprotein [Niabella sp.]HQX21530.1 DUF5000 domain-containing lipoprotein [Niabella sp.]HQX42440.1 DUF5000 domain-containing lipoprotein [Niabella sp.]